ncbi:MerR family transcriptional regulator [Paenibacillus alkaliterrae]|uniref:MerR family transcriptional regulator n=1 Tax=Paenibacillus alkaliterrae TaxID=320909 RepID=UPI001F2F5DBB|nr:MerR family transcriptional regulator [Paenibacillus alkaliterrae]MCF2938101.1 MerR family transcriptional regulator [Paenibacillus alkaliterrae]
MKKRFTIGQLSKLHHIPIKTLRYYDEIGLFKPVEVDAENQYRYYSIEQFEQLDIILYLKTLGVPLKEIKHQITNKNLNELVEAFKFHKQLTERKIKELERINQRFESRIKEIESTRDVMDIGVPILKNVPKRTIVQVMGKIRSLYELELSLRMLKKEFHQVSPIIIGKVGLTLSVTDIIKGNYSEYNSIFILLEEADHLYTSHEMISVLPEGKYATIYYRGDTTEAGRYYQMVLDFLEKENFYPNGDFILRTIIDRFITNDPEEYLIEIQIPIH